MDDQDTPELDAPSAEKPQRRRKPVVPVVVPLADVTGKSAGWYDRAPLSAQVFMQFGFAGLMAVVFVVQFRETSAENRASREMYRDDMAAMRVEIAKAVTAAVVRDTAADARTDRVVEQLGQLVHRVDKVSEKMTDVNYQLQRTTDALHNAGVNLKKAADKMGDPTPDNQGGTAPPPRLKYPFTAPDDTR